MNIQIIDDAIPKYLQDIYELYILGNNKEQTTPVSPIIDFKCNYETTGIEKGKLPLNFSHVLKSDSAISTHLQLFSKIPQLICQIQHRDLLDILVARIFLIMPYNTNLTHYAPHIDLDIKHTVLLYYVNDADGDTVFFNNDGTIFKSVSPKKGRVILFDGTLLHGGGVPRKHPRCIINFDLLTREDYES